MSQRQRFDVIVAGAGPVGYAMALLVARQGLSCCLIDPNLTPSDEEVSDHGLRVSALSPASQTLLHSLDVWQPEALHACAYERMRVWEDRIDHAIEFDAERLGESVLGHIVPNGRLRQALCRAAEQQSQLHTMSTAISSTEDLGSRREVILADGSALRCRLLLVADGARSVLREALSIAVQVDDYQQDAVVAHVQLTQPHGGEARQRFVQGQPIGLLPLLDDQLSVVWSTDRENAQALMAQTQAGFLLRLQQALGDAELEVSAVLGRGRYPLKRQRARRLIAARAALLGDAAGSVHPLAGQGLNLGFGDVACLAAIMSRLDSGDDPGQSTLLRRYERQRRAERASLDGGIHGLQRLFAASTPGLPAIRSLGLQLVDRLGPIKHAFARRALR
jgi:ubiquinone biosynthesis UbiH/UbiF/VisC/COQ6 family hydroxylase